MRSARGAAPASAPRARAAVGERPVPGWWWVAGLYGIVGLLFRLVLFSALHQESDEVVFQVLVQRMNAGLSYSLQGSPLLGTAFTVEQYGAALFYHPPGGIVFFRALALLFGYQGFLIAELVSYALFFAGMIWIARLVLGPLTAVRLHGIALLAAFTPIMTHVVSRIWLDGPSLGFTTLACAVFLFAVRRGSPGLAALAGLTLGYASLVKTSAFVVLPGLLALAWAITEPGKRRAMVLHALVFVGLAALVQSPWEIWQWRVLGTPFPPHSGAPPPVVVASNRYVHLVTAERPPWIYFTLTPRALWTLAPSLLCLTLPALTPRARRVALALVVWIVVVLAAGVAAGAAGYSKLLRYVILVTPATVLLFGLMLGEAWERARAARAAPGARTWARALLALLAVGLVLEVVQGIVTPVFQPTLDLIVPILWPAGRVM